MRSWRRCGAVLSAGESNGQTLGGTSVVADWVVWDRYHLLSRIALWQALIGSAASAVVTIGGVT